RGACIRARVGDADRGRIGAGREQPADQAASHVAAADEGDDGKGSGRSRVGHGVAWRAGRAISPYRRGGGNVGPRTEGARGAPADGAPRASPGLGGAGRPDPAATAFGSMACPAAGPVPAGPDIRLKGLEL